MSDLDEEEYEYTRRLKDLKPIEGTREYYEMIKKEKENKNGGQQK